MGVQLTLHEELCANVQLVNRVAWGSMSLHTIFETTVYSHRLHGPPVSLALPARIVLPGGGEHSCRIVEASTGEFILAASPEPRYGDRVAIYTREFGRFEGHVERRTGNGFAVALDLPEPRRRRLASQLIWFANRDSCGMDEVRRHERFVPRMPWTSVRTPDGAQGFGQINDISIAGVSVNAAARVCVGDRVAIGIKAAVVGRVFDGGFAAEFEEPFAEGELSEATIL